MKKTFLLAAVCLVPFTLSASEIKPYMGADFVYSHLNWESRLKDFYEKDYYSGSINLGAKVHKYLGLELSYHHANEQTKKLGGGIETKVKYTSFVFDVMGYLPVDAQERFEAIALAGVGSYRFSVKATAPTAYSKGTETKMGSRLGLGLQYNINDNWALRTMGRYTWLDIDGVDGITDVTVGVQYKF